MTRAIHYPCAVQTILLALILGVSLNHAVAATSYLYPGVYVEEVPGGARPIQAHGASTTAFLGIAPNPGAKPGESHVIQNWTDFVSSYANDAAKSTPLSLAVYGFFQNGGSRCFVVNLGKSGDLAAGLMALEKNDEIALVAAPGYTRAEDYEDILTHCEKMVDRFAILDCREDATPETVIKNRPRNSDRGVGAVYFPWIIIKDPQNAEKVACPPSGHIAGIFARTDATRGIHKAPANEFIRGALDLTHPVTGEENGELNPLGINAIRNFPGEGIKVFGARTLADQGSEWRYINVRRLTMMIEESIAEGTRWAVFEPNDQALWKALRRDTGAFLTTMWRGGALFGASPEEAFFVKCDEETNWNESGDAEHVRIVIGLAPVKPAEFIIFTIEQSVGGATLKTSNE